MAARRPLLVLLALLALLATCSRAPRGSSTSSPSPAPPPADWRWDLTPDEVAAGCRAAHADLEAHLASLVAIPDRERTFANTIAALEAASSDYDETTNHLTFLAEVHQDATVRTSSAGKLVVTATYPDMFPLLKQCRVEATRHEAWLVLWGRGGVDNVARLREVLALRDEEHRLLGYASVRSTSKRSCAPSAAERRYATAGCNFAWRGNVMRNVVSRSSDSTASVPPWASTIARAM